MSKKEEKIHKPILSFSRGTISYYFLCAVIVVVLAFGFFDPTVSESTKETLGSYSDYQIIAKKQGMNVYEVKLYKKDDLELLQPVPIPDLKNILWIVAQTYEIQSFHPIEEKGKTLGIIVTIDNE